MSVNFLDKSAVMVGVDLHAFCPLVPPGAEIPIWPYLVGAPFSWPSMWWKLTKKTTAETNAMVQDGWTLILVPHIPYPAPPGPKQALEYLGIVVTSGSEPLLSIASVTAEGSSLAICVYGCAGVNLNCGPFESDQLTGAVLCVSSVQTTPTLMDVVAAVIKVIGASILAPIAGFLAGKGFDKLGIGKKIVRPILKKVFDAVAKPLIEFIARQIAKKIAELVTPTAQSAVKAMGL